MIRTVLIVLGVLGAVVGLAAIIGARMPREHVVASEIVLPATPDTVWSVIRRPEILIGTWPELTRSSRRPDALGREVWEQEVDGFAMRFLVTEPGPRWLVSTILPEEDAVFGGQWEYQAITVREGTKVRVTETGWVGNPLFRVMMAVMGPHRSIDGYLTGLGKHFGQEVIPVHLP